MIKHFLSEPLWFKILITLTLFASILLSSSWFPSHGYYKSISKLAAAIFFCSYGIKLRRNRQISMIFFALTAVCIYLIWDNLQLA